MLPSRVFSRTMSKTETLENTSFEQALQELEGIVRELEGGQGDLDGAIKQYERGTALKKHCMQKLEAARMKVEKIMQQPDGSLKTEPLDAEA